MGDRAIAFNFDFSCSVISSTSKIVVYGAVGEIVCDCQIEDYVLDS